MSRKRMTFEMASALFTLLAVLCFTMWAVLNTAEAGALQSFIAGMFGGAFPVFALAAWFTWRTKE